MEELASSVERELLELQNAWEAANEEMSVHQHKQIEAHTRSRPQADREAGATGDHGGVAQMSGENREGKGNSPCKEKECPTGNRKRGAPSAKARLMKGRKRATLLLNEDGSTGEPGADRDLIQHQEGPEADRFETAKWKPQKIDTFSPRALSEEEICKCKERREKRKSQVKVSMMHTGTLPSQVPDAREDGERPKQGGNEAAEPQEPAAITQLQRKINIVR